MATITVEADVDLDEFDTIEIIKELEYRIKHGNGSYNKGFEDKERKRLIAMYALLNTGIEINMSSLLDEMKLEAFMEAKDKFSLSELQEVLKK